MGAERDSENGSGSHAASAPIVPAERAKAVARYLSKASAVFLSLLLASSHARGDTWDAFNHYLFGDLRTYEDVKDDNAEFRFFYNQRSIRDSGLDSMLRERGLPEAGRLGGFGIDLTLGARAAQVGLRAVYDRTQYDGATPAGPLPEGAAPGPDHTRLQAFTLAPIVRFYPIDRQTFRLDFSGSLGFTWSQVDMQKDGVELIHGSSVGPIGHLGAGISVGKKSFFVFAEGGYKWMRARLDFNGPYFAVGLSFPDFP